MQIRFDCSNFPASCRITLLVELYHATPVPCDMVMCFFAMDLVRKWHILRVCVCVVAGRVAQFNTQTIADEIEWELCIYE